MTRVPRIRWRSVASFFANLGVIIALVLYLSAPQSLARRVIDATMRGARAKVVLHLRADELFSSQHLVRVGNGPRVIEFVDYECTFCRQMSSDLHRAIRDLDASVYVLHVASREARTSAFAAAKVLACLEGPKARWALHQWLLDSTDWRAGADWGRVVRELEVEDEVSEVLACLARPGTDVVVERQRQLAYDLGVRMTPTLLASGQLYSGLRTHGELVELLSRR